MATTAPIRLPPVINAARSVRSISSRASDSGQGLPVAEKARPRRLGPHPSFGGLDGEHRRIETWTDLVPVERHRYGRPGPPAHRERRHDRLSGGVAHDVEKHGRTPLRFSRLDGHELRM